MTTRSRFEQRVVDLRDTFDQAFAIPPALLAEETEDVLLVRIGGDPYVLRSGEMSGLASGKKIAPVPSRRPELVGIVGIRGSLVPVYGLMTLLGYVAQASTSRWLALLRGAETVALAFQEFEGFVRVPTKDMHPAGNANARRHVRQVAHVGGLARSVVDIDSALEFLKTRAGVAGPIKEG